MSQEEVRRGRQQSRRFVSSVLAQGLQPSTCKAVILPEEVLVMVVLDCTGCFFFFFFFFSMKVYAKEQGIQDSIANGQLCCAGA